MSDDVAPTGGDSSGTRRAVLFDRDGTLNVNAPSGDYLRKCEDLKILPGAAEALKTLADAGYVLAVYTNQSGIAKGLMSSGDVEEINDLLVRSLGENGAPLSGVYYCPHNDEDNCDCRKPKPGLLLTASEELGLDLSSSWAVGDSARDMVAGMAAGCRAVFVHGNAYPGQREKAEALPISASVAGLAEAASFILEADSQKLK